MAVPILKRENTLGITYIEGEIKEHHFEIIIERVLGVPEEEVIGIDNRGNARFLFEVSTQQRYANICVGFTGRDIPIEHGIVIQVDDISSCSTMVKLSRVPLNLDNDVLTQILQKYGEVEKCQNYFRKFGKYCKLKKSGDRIAWMQLTQMIPQSLYIKHIENFIYVKHPNQQFTCNKCGDIGHRGRFCNVQPEDFKHVVDVNVLDPLQTEINRDDNGHSGDVNNSESLVEVSAENMDVHIDPSQNNKTFFCSECDYQCSYEHIFTEHMEQHKGEKSFLCSECGYQTSTMCGLDKHMQIHTGEKPLSCTDSGHIQKHTGENHFKCHICELVSIGRAAHEEHALIHDDEILISCSECEFQCRNENVLTNHLTSHDIHACKKCNFQGKTSKILANHVKTHTEKSFKCSKCEFTCTIADKFKHHMKNHSGGEKTSKSYSDTVKSPVSKKVSITSNTLKRGLSVSPEVVDTSKKTLRSNTNISKKSKN